VLDFEIPQDQPAFIVMERLEGNSLSALIRAQAPLAPQRVAFITVQVLLALSAAHEHQIIHRDLKPENVFLTSISGFDDIVRVLDFGIAKIVNENEMSRLTHNGAVIGTPAYMAPEQARGEDIDLRSDLYSVGVVMYECLIGRPPFQAQNLHALLGKIFAGKVDPVGALRPELDDRLVGVVERAMSTNRLQRYGSAYEMIEDLKPLFPRRNASEASTPVDPPSDAKSGYFKTTIREKP
jgi:serine/threonine-protein kinase